MENDPENQGVGLAEEMPLETGQPGEPGGNGASTDGLAADLLSENGDGPGNGAGPDGDLGNPKRRGRPPVHGLYSKAAGSDGKNPVPPAGGGAIPPAQVAIPAKARVAIPPDMLSKVVTEGLNVAEAWGQGKLSGVGQKAGLSREEIEPNLAMARAGEERKRLVGDLTPYVLEEWGVDADMSPTLAVMLILGPVMFAGCSAYYTMAKIAVEKAARDQAEKS